MISCHENRIIYSENREILVITEQKFILMINLSLLNITLIVKQFIARIVFDILSCLKIRFDKKESDKRQRILIYLENIDSCVMFL